jgi:hypothetical protein
MRMIYVLKETILSVVRCYQVRLFYVSLVQILPHLSSLEDPIHVRLFVCYCDV